jgi:hypothetical protein
MGCVCVWLHCDPWALPTPHSILFVPLNRELSCPFSNCKSSLLQIGISSLLIFENGMQKLYYNLAKLRILFLLQYIGPLKCVNYEASSNNVHILSTQSIDFSVTHVTYIYVHYQLQAKFPYTRSGINLQLRRVTVLSPHTLEISFPKLNDIWMYSRPWILIMQKQMVSMDSSTKCPLVSKHVSCSSHCGNYYKTSIE